MKGIIGMGVVHSVMSLMLKTFNGGFASPKCDKLKKYFRRFGYVSYVHEMKCELQADYNIYINKLNFIVDQRNKIAHGDPDASSTPKDLRDDIIIIKKFCMATDILFANWCSQNICAIR